jgi:iron complex outermembrane receptor protein
MILSVSPRVMAVEAGGAADTGALEEVTVTAQRRSENLQRVPIAVDTVSGQDALERGTNSIQSLPATIPNLAFTTSGLFTNTYIRGVGDTSASPNNEPSAAVYVDGVYNPSPYAMTSLAFNNIQQIEVLKGPQGTLFGRNATAGVIQILTPDPKQQFGGKADVGYANFNTPSADFYVTGGVTDKLSGDLSLYYLNLINGYGHDLTTGTPTFRQRNEAARSKWLYTPFETTKIRFTADWGKFDSDGLNAQFAPNSIPPYAGRYNTVGTPTKIHITQWGASVRVDQDIGELLHGVSISSWRSVDGGSFVDNDLQAPVYNQLDQHFDSNYWTEELQLTNQTPGRVNWLVGAFYYGNQVFGADPWRQFGSKVAGGFRAFNAVQDTASGSLFAQATADVGWDTKLTLGARYTYETLTTYGRIQNSTGAIITGGGPFRQQIKSTPMTYRFALDHQFTTDLLGYVSYNKGFKSGGFNLASPGSAPFFPEHVDAYEAGFKSEFLNHRVRANVAGFYYHYTDLQVAVLLGGAQLFENAAAARNYGLDSTLDVAATEHLTLSAGLGLLNAKYISYPGARGFSPLGVQTLIPNAKGADLPFAPAVTGFVSASYRIPTAIGVFKPTANVSYNDVSYVTPDMAFRRPTYTMVTASVEWRSPGDQSLAVRLWGKNLNNAEYALFASESALGWYRGEGPPRTYGITIEKDFGGQ